MHCSHHNLGSDHDGKCACDRNGPLAMTRSTWSWHTWEHDISARGIWALGILVLGIFKDNPVFRAHATLRLENQVGEVLWKGNFKPRKCWLRCSRTGTLQRRAYEAAKQLRKDWRKALQEWK